MPLIWTVPEQHPHTKKMRLAEPVTVSNFECLKPQYVGVAVDSAPNPLLTNPLLLFRLARSKILPSMSILITNDKVVASTLACDLLPHMEEGVGKEELMSSLMSFAGNDLQICNKILDNNDGRITLGVTGSAKLYGLIVDVLETKNASSSANSDFDLALMTLPNLVKGEHFSAKQIEKLTKVLQSNPILEAFGNARTIRCVCVCVCVCVCKSSSPTPS